MRNTLAALLMGCMAAIAPHPLQAQPAAASEIRFAATTFEFGKVFGSTVVRATFVLTNTGTSPLEIKNVQPGCGCTTVDPWDRWVAPGSNTTLVLRLNTSNLSGPVTKSATVSSNDPKQPIATLLIQGEVWKPLYVQPNVVVFGPVFTSTNDNVRVVKVVNNTEEMIVLQDPVSSNPSFRPTLRIIKPGKEFELRITANPPFAAGTVKGTITAKTSSTNMTQISVTALSVTQTQAAPLTPRLKASPSAR